MLTGVENWARTHALARRSLALRSLSLNYENVLASRRDKVVGNAGADNPSADENDVCRVHSVE